MTTPPTTNEVFENLVVPVVFGEAGPSDEPTLTLMLGALSSGRSRATARVRAQDTPDAAVVNAADLRSFYPDSSRPTPDDIVSAAAEWLQRSLAHAREQRRSLIVEGNFRSPALVAGIARLFQDAGFRTRLVAVADRDAETQMSAISLRLEQARAGLHVDPHTDAVDLVEWMRAVGAEGTIDRTTILHRDGRVVFDDAADEPGHDDAVAAFEAARREPLGTLRSTLWLSELRHASQFARTLRDVPHDATVALIDLHEAALDEVVPELPIPVDSDARRIQEERLQASLTELRELVSAEVRKSRTPEVQEDLTGPVVPPVPDRRGPSL
ncbi:zeta toxin family protein [Microbacterium invictum]|uniref:UDP-N-acetylglucosamine kinase n=1 Tax=Microbacterium invictum TaxID=515415 RepID=A0AA40VNT2_9MICO|nr:zeta toxin family protein [Microbacterium invictum]MBB4140763.1 hypothetical protein [Microbacterium invictum]